MKDKQIILPQNRFRWFYLIGFFLILALPLLVLPPWFTPFGWGKTIVFRIILSILIFFFIKQVLSKKISSAYIKDKIKTVSLAFWLLFALFGIYLLSTIFSLDRSFSFWGSPYRSGGFVNFAFYIIFAVITFLIVRQKDWQKIWDFTIIVGILISIITIFQQFGIFSKFFIPFTIRPVGTIGNPIFLAIYLLLLTFLTLSFGIKSKNRTKKAFYFFSLLLFLSVVIILTQTRAAFAGLAMGSLWFLFAYPKKIKKLKIIFAIILVFVLFGMYSAKIYLDSHLYVYQKMPPIISSTVDRTLSMFEPTKSGESRISAWKVSWEALKDRPVLGYGPENFSIGFDKYYDPSLPGITPWPWWDRAHNFIFDISVTAGIPALIIYLSLFGTLFWQLQKVKRRQPETAIICHGLQATFIAYLVANFFSFDIFDTYLISFLLIGYSLHLISTYNPNLRILSESTNKQKQRTALWRLKKWRGVAIFLLFLCLVWFIWAFNIKPFKINTQVNIAKYLVENGKCEQAFVRMDNILAKRSFLDAYLRLKYADFLRKCEAKMPGKNLEFAKKGNQLLKENIKIQPYYTKNWLFLGEFTNVLIEKEKNPEVRQELIKEAIYYFEKAYLLSPKREESLSQLINMYIRIKNYQGLAETYPRLISITSDKTKKAQLYASLAVVYKELGDKGKAREVALKALELHPKAKPVIDEFLRSLEQ